MKALHKWLNKHNTPTSFEKNTYTPNKLKVVKTVYPNGKPTLSPNTGTEWYGLVDNFKTK